MEKNTGKVREFCQSGKVGTMSKSQCDLALRSQDSRRLYNNSTYNPFDGLCWLVKECKQLKLSDMSSDVAALKLTLSVNRS